ncbi:g-patch domain-containing protein [Cystoisospora suis]|uniref:G-patch domain-containing protein n=1 Tax=Cystoisospora suis TaxID=483139 RepID=A0A2C6KK95_9APIC|nr:g-patch domain-containing protein [Cystoisospora suis]
MSTEDTSRRLRFGGGFSSSSSAASRKKEQIYGIFADDVDEQDYAERRPGFLQDSSSDDEANGDGRSSGRKGRVGARIEFVRGGVWKPEQPVGEVKKGEGSVGLRKKKKTRPGVGRDAEDQEEHEGELDTREEAASVEPSLREQLLNAQVLKEVLGDAYASSEEDEEGSEKAGTKEEEEDERHDNGKSESEEKEFVSGPQPSDQPKNGTSPDDRKENSSEPQKKRQKIGESEDDTSSEDDSLYESSHKFKFTEAQLGKGETGGLEGGHDGGGRERPIVPEKNTWGFAKMERTYGVGFKLLKKMGFKGGGLGRHGTGVANPLEVRVREKNRGLQDSGEKVGRPSKKNDGLTALDILLGRKQDKDNAETALSDAWRKGSSAAQNKSSIEKRKRRMAKTAAELAAEGRLQQQKSRDKVASKSVRIIDMTGPEVRLIEDRGDLKNTLLQHKLRVRSEGGDEEEEGILTALAEQHDRKKPGPAPNAPLRSLQMQLRMVIREVEDQLRRVVGEKKEEEGYLLQETEEESDEACRGGSVAGEGEDSAIPLEEAVAGSVRSSRTMASRVDQIYTRMSELRNRLVNEGVSKGGDGSTLRGLRRSEGEKRDRGGERPRRSERDRWSRSSSSRSSSESSREDRRRRRENRDTVDKDKSRSRTSPGNSSPLSAASSPLPDPFGLTDVLSTAQDLHARFPFEFRLLHIPTILTALLRARLHRHTKSWNPLSTSAESSSVYSVVLPSAVGRLVGFFASLQQQEPSEVHAFAMGLSVAEAAKEGNRDKISGSWALRLVSGQVEGSKLQSREHRRHQNKVTFPLSMHEQSGSLRFIHLPMRVSLEPYRFGNEALEHILSLALLEQLRSSLVNSWHPDGDAEGNTGKDEKQGESSTSQHVCVVTLVERWLGALPPSLGRRLVEEVVLQKLSKAVDAWEPAKATVPIHTWLHPWLPHLSAHHLQLLSSPLRVKIGHALEAYWNPRDRSAVNLLLPWQHVFDTYSFAALLQRSVMPKLHDHLLNVPIRPDNQQLEGLQDVLVWAPLLPVEMLVNLFVTAFFPRWLQVLKVWLSSTHADFNEILEWYSGWKDTLPAALVAHTRVQGIFVEALQLMNFASAALGLPIIQQQPVTLGGMGGVVPTPPSSGGMEPPRAPEPAEPTPPTLLEYLEGLAKEKGILFKPKVGRVEEGKQVYAYGRMNMYVKEKMIYVKGKAVLSWTAVDVDELLKLAKGEWTTVPGSSRRDTS